MRRTTTITIMALSLLMAPAAFAQIPDEQQTGRELPSTSAPDDAPQTPEKTPLDSGLDVAANTDEYVVSEGDTLSGIAQKELGDAGMWRQIAQVNAISDPTKLEVGKRLSIPKGDAGSQKGTGSSPTPGESDDSPDSLF